MERFVPRLFVYFHSHTCRIDDRFWSAALTDAPRSVSGRKEIHVGSLSTILRGRKVVRAPSTTYMHDSPNSRTAVRIPYSSPQEPRRDGRPKFPLVPASRLLCSHHVAVERVPDWDVLTAGDPDFPSGPRAPPRDPCVGWSEPNPVLIPSLPFLGRFCWYQSERGVCVDP